MRPNPVAELTDADNEPFLGTLTPEAWVGLAVEAIASEWYSFDTATELHNLIKKGSPSSALVTRALLSSGSIEGKAADRIERAAIGAPATAQNLSVPIVNVPPQNAPNESSKGGNPPRRGF